MGCIENKMGQGAAGENGSPVRRRGCHPKREIQIWARMAAVGTQDEWTGERFSMK